MATLSEYLNLPKETGISICYFTMKELLNMSEPVKEVGLLSTKKNGLVIAFPQNKNKLGRHTVLVTHAKDILNHHYKRMVKENDDLIGIMGSFIQEGTLFEIIGFIQPENKPQIKTLFGVKATIRFSDEKENPPNKPTTPKR